MGGINSKRKFTIKGIKRKRARKRETADGADEPVYEEIDLARDDARDASDGSYISAPSVDSAFSERSSTITPRGSSLNSLVYDEPEDSVGGRAETYDFCPYDVYKGAADDTRDDDDDDDDHTYESELSLWETDSDSTSLKKSCTESRRLGRPYKCQVPLEEVPYMVEAFLPLLELTIDVTEVAPHMPFIDAHEFIYGDDARTKVNLLIERIRSCNEAGKWQAFLHALNQAEYQYIVSLLRGETEEDHSENRNLLKLFTPQIMNRIDPEEFIDHLFEKGVINDRDKEEVRCEKERRGAIAASFMLLHKVPRRVSNWFAVFLDVLEKCGMDDLLPEFNIPNISVATMSDCKTMDEDKYYLTPTCDGDDNDNGTQRKFPCSRRLQHGSSRPSSEPFLTRTQVPASKSLLTRTTASVYKPLPTRTTASVYKPLPTRTTSSVYKNLPTRTTAFSYKPQLPPVPVPPLIVRSPRHRKTQVELLMEEKKSLQREIEEKLLTRQYKRDVKALKLQLEKLNSDDTDEDDMDEDDKGEIVEKDTSCEIVNDVLNGNVVVNKEDHNKENATNEKISDLDIDTNQMQQINTLFVDMKQELKNDILAMRDHVTEAVLKSVFGLISGSVSSEEEVYGYSGQTILSHKVPLYSTRGLLAPKSHNMHRHYSVDSAMCSDLSYVYA